MIGLALSGGGSRAIAFHLGCLRALDDLGVLNRIEVLSTISGGSVIGAYYAYTPEKEFAEFESDVRRFLARGFAHSILRRLVYPKHTFAAIRNLGATTADLFRERIGGQPIFRGHPSVAELRPMHLGAPARLPTGAAALKIIELPSRRWRKCGVRRLVPTTGPRADQF